MQQATHSRGPWDLRPIHTGGDSATYDVLNADGEPVLEINRIHTPHAEQHWKANLQLVRRAPQLKDMVERQQELLRTLLEMRGSDPAAMRAAIEAANTLLESLADDPLKTPT